MNTIDTVPRRAAADPAASPAEIYRARRDRFAAEHRAALGRSRYLSYGRVAAFLLAIGFGVWAESSPAPLPILAVALSALAFVVLIAAHRRSRRGERRAEELAALNEEALLRLERDWDALPVRHPTRDITGHRYAHDLDLYGRASITQILGPVSGVGARVIDDWLLSHAEPPTVRARQDSVRELTPLLDLREALAVQGRRAAAARTEELDHFISWAEGDAESPIRAPVLWAARLIPLCTVVLAALQLLGRVDEPYWQLPIAGALLLTLTAGRRATATFRRAGPGEELIEHYPELLKVAERASFSAALLSDIGSRIAVAGRPASRELERLAQLLHLADLRRSGMLYLPVQLLTLWDFHILNSLERWRRRAGSEVRGWLEAAGELEALASIAALAHDHPGWTFAEFTDSADAVIEGVGIGHPLIPEARRVDNDIRIGPPGTFLLVTGSNMSGKSTLLRAIGTNTVLARAGAPCCARRFRIPPVELWSCIRIDDSLAEGVSYFMAELKRLKEIVDAATRPNGAEGPTILFLIDEVLNGTNTAERQIAARRVIRHLVERGAIGVVTTHDLDFAQGPELAERAELVHFRETLTQNDAGRLEMTFDYQLRPGLATSTNALALLEFVGLPGE